MNLNLFLAGSPEGGEGADPMQTIIMFGLIFIVFYFFMIRPQQKRAKKQKEFRASLEKGTKVITIGGIHGKILEVNDEDDTVTVQVDGARLKMDKSAVNADSSAQMTEESKKTA